MIFNVPGEVSLSRIGVIHGDALHEYPKSLARASMQYEVEIPAYADFRKENRNSIG